jgi:hypothetical protein
MNEKRTAHMQRFFDEWKQEDRQLEDALDVMRDWMSQVAQLGVPHFGEAGTRLQSFRNQLVEHFAREDELLAELSDCCDDSSESLAATRRQTDRDHQQLLERLDDLVTRLNELDPPFISWQAAIEELELLTVLVEQHEDQESESLCALIPSET